MIVDGWFDFAIRDPGPAGSVNGGRNSVRGIVPHSAEGHWATLEDLHDFHWSRATNPDPRKRASWGATNLKDGRFVQHYSVWAQTWTSGSAYPNNNFFAFENEGVAGESLTQAQIDNIIRVGRDLIALQGWLPRRPRNVEDTTASLYEHNECDRWGANATACPSGRIPWNIIVPALQGSGRMYTDKEIDAKIGAVLAALVDAVGHIEDTNTKLEALQASTDFLIKVVNHLAPRVAALETFNGGK